MNAIGQLLALHGRDANSPSRGPEAPDSTWPANLHWLGRVRESLHAALAARVARVVSWSAPPGWPEAGSRKQFLEAMPGTQRA